MRLVLEALPLLIPILAFPFAWMLLDVTGALRGRHARSALEPPRTMIDDFTVLVPIYGSVSYLRNIDWLRDYPGRVWLLTTTAETAAFTRDLAAIATANGFRVFATDVPGRVVGARRATSGAMRDTLVRDALEHVRSEYVVCVDADTTTVHPVSDLVSILVANRFDFASIRLTPRNTESWLAKLQEYEYRVAMRMRLLAPWLVSGACHAARTEVHRQIMRRHSLFFQGNDIEAGVLAHRLGYRVGHVPFEVRTDVPDDLRSWFRQRLAWSGGEFRLFVMNAHVIRSHAWLWLYGLVLMLLMLPLRWLSVIDYWWSFATVYLLYLLVSLYIHRGRLNRWIFAMPLYAIVTSLLMTPLGIGSYIMMAIRDRNLGHITMGRPLVGARHLRQS